MLLSSRSQSLSLCGTYIRSTVSVTTHADSSSQLKAALTSVEPCWGQTILNLLDTGSSYFRMSGHSTPFIPPLDTPEPAVFPSVIPPSPPAIQSSRYPSGPVSGAPSAGWEAQPQQAQLPLYGTPYIPAPFIAVSPYSQGLPSTTFNYSPLPPVAPNGLSADYRGYPDFLQTPLVGTGGTAPPVNAPVIPPHGTPWHAGGAIPLHHGPPPGAFPSSPWGAPRGWPSGGGVHYPTNWGPFISPDGYPANFPAWGGGFGGWFNPGVQPPAQQEPPRRSNKETGDRMPRFTAGPHCGLIDCSRYLGNN